MVSRPRPSPSQQCRKGAGPVEQCPGLEYLSEHTLDVWRESVFVENHSGLPWCEVIVLISSIVVASWGSLMLSKQTFHDVRKFSGLSVVTYSKDFICIGQWTWQPLQFSHCYNDPSKRSPLPPVSLSHCQQSHRRANSKVCQASDFCLLLSQRATCWAK